MQPDPYLLLVDDNAQISELVLHALAEQHPHLNVTSLADGAEALDFLHARGNFASRSPTLPAVILLDIKMPRVNGLEVLREIKEDAGLKSIPVVMFSSSRQQEDLQTCYQLGANAYVLKPAHFQELCSVVNLLATFWTSLNVTPPPPALLPEPAPACLTEPTPAQRDAPLPP